MDTGCQGEKILRVELSRRWIAVKGLVCGITMMVLSLPLAFYNIFLWIGIEVLALLCGLAGGCILMAIMRPLSLLFRDAASAYSLPVSCLLHTALPFLSVLGAFAALPRSDKSHSHRSKRH
jgi:hypothetical protein